jgi:hypothetical protein
LGKRISTAISTVAQNFNTLPAKKRNIKADSAADALKQRFPEINASEIDFLFD